MWKGTRVVAEGPSGSGGRCCGEELIFALGMEKTYNGPDVWMNVAFCNGFMYLAFIYYFYLFGSGQPARKV